MDRRADLDDLCAPLHDLACAELFLRPAASVAALAQIVPRAQFANANAWLSSGQQIGATAGPALGGLVIAATGGATTVYWLDTIAALIFVATLSTISPGCDPALWKNGRATTRSSAPASSSSSAPGCSYRRSRSISSRCSSAVRPRCCRSTPRTSCTSARAA